MIRTVLGDINNEALGNVLMHEHIQCVSNDMLRAFGEKWLDENKLEQNAVKILKELKSRIGLDVFVDGTPADLGRNIRLLKRISEQSGVHIIASSGMYYYPSMVSCGRSAEELAKWFIYECEKGIEGTDIKPGILKCAADSDGITADIAKRTKALAITQAETGLPMYAHCSHTDNLAHEMADIFESNGANPKKIILGHASRRLDVDYLDALLARGYYICIDQSWSTEPEASAVLELCRRGYEKKLLFSQDRSIYNDFEREELTGLDNGCETHIERYSYLSERLIPELEARGCNIERQMLFLRQNAMTALNIM